MKYAAESYDSEATRVAVIKDTIAKICDVDLAWYSDRFGIKPDALNTGDIPFLVVEVKNEAGMEGDASLEAALSYACIASSPCYEVRIILRLLSSSFILLMLIVGFTEEIELSRCSLRHYG